MITVGSLPGEPLSLNTVIGMSDTHELAMRSDTSEILAIILFSDDHAHALGYEPENEGWVQIERGPAYAETTEDVEQVTEAIEEWLESTYPEEYAADDVEMVSKDQQRKHRRPPEVEQGLEPEYDCPECDYYKTGLTTGPHAFLDHLQDEHDYSSEEAHKAMNG